MTKATVTREIVIPGGYELAEPVMRKAVKGDIFLNNNLDIEVWDANYSSTSYYPILRKEWKPEVGKWYLFSDIKYNVGTRQGAFSEFTGMKDGRYVEVRDETWKYCWPVPDTFVLGK